MTDASKTPTPQPWSQSPSEVVAQFLSAARKLAAAERADGFTTGGVTINYSADGNSLTGTFTIPLERVVNPDGSETIKPATFIK